MANTLFKITFVAIITLGLAACASPPTKEDTGRVVGAVVGGVLGSNVGKGRGKVAATIAGTLIGGAIGGAIGKNMDDVDRLKTRNALETAPTNQASSWHNPDSGRDYTVTPTKTYQSSSGPCREYTTEVIIGGQREQAYGTACRESDGSWRVVN